MGIAARHADPDQPVGAQGLAMAAALGLGGQRKVTAARAQLLAHDLRILAHQADPHARLRPGEAAQDARHEAADDVVGHAEPHLALERRPPHVRQQLVGLAHQPLRLRQQPLASRGQHQPAADPLEQAAVEHLLQPLDLLAGRRLAHVERRRGRRDAAAVDHGEEGAQEINHKEYPNSIIQIIRYSYRMAYAILPP